ncbi:MAG: hypothetical protein FK733_04400 [Asgard group archaeon]|nr:hypothetical protein [Asgard group archaeon]
MKETTIAFITFFATIFLLMQLKLIGRIRREKFRRKLSGYGNHLMLADALGAACEVCSCIGDCCECAIEEEEGSRKEEKIKFIDPKEERSKVMEIMTKEDKVAVWKLSHKTGIHKKRVREIIEEDPEYIVDQEVAYNKKSLEDEHLAEILERKEKEKELEAEKTDEEIEIDVSKFKVEEPKLLVRDNPFALVAIILGTILLILVMIPFENLKAIIYLNFIIPILSVVTISVGAYGIAKKHRKEYAIMGVIFGIAGVLFWLIEKFIML